MSLFPVFAPVALNPVEVSLPVHGEDGTTATAYTFSAVSFGATDATRKLVISASGIGNAGGTKTVSTLTADGNSCTFILRSRPSANDHYITELWYVDLATGTSGDVVITFSAAMDNCGMGLWRVVNAASGGASATDKDEDKSDPQTASLNVPANGICIGAAATNDTSSDGQWAWTNLDEDYDHKISNGAGHSGASKAFTAAQSPLVVTADPSTGTIYRLVCASFGPA